MTERPEYTSIEAVEDLALQDQRKGWAAMRLARIRLGVFGGRWFYATEYNIVEGMFQGSASPLGFWSDYPPRMVADTREEAFNAAVSSLRSVFETFPKQCRQHLQWLDELTNPPAVQLDLF